MQHRNIRANPHSVVIRMQPAPLLATRTHLFQRVILPIISLLAFQVLLLATTTATATAQAAGGGDSVPALASSSVVAASAPESLKLRVLALRRKETVEGARLTLTSDSPLNNYSSYVEGERLFVLVPLTALAGAQENLNGRGFSDMRVEPKGRDLLLSFRLQVGASVYVRQHFNRLELAFSTNEQVNRN